MRAKLLAATAALALISALPSRAATTYVYDNLGRVSTVTYDSGLQITYSYDSAGNRTTVVTQTGTNRPPQANNDRVNVTLNTPLTFDPRVNDTDPDGDALTISAVGTASHGSATKTSTSVTYTPTTNYTGQDSFTYTISDGHSHTASATVYATVAAGIPPIAVNDSITTALNTAKTFDPRANDSEPNPPGYALTISSTTTPGHGAVVINSGTSLTYTPTSGFEGPDSFTYTISDGHGQTATASVSVFVGSPPTAVADFQPVPLNTATSFDPRVNDSDPNGLYLTIASTTTPSHGTIAIVGGTGLTYTPTTGYSGPDSFNYTITNSSGLSATATDSMCVGALAPVTSTHTMLIAASHQSGTPIIPQGSIDPRSGTGGDTDPCGGALSITAVTQGVKGTVIINLSGTPITYTYNTTVYGILNTTDSFTYTVTDPFGASTVGTVNVTIDIELNN